MNLVNYISIITDIIVVLSIIGAAVWCRKIFEKLEIFYIKKRIVPMLVEVTNEVVNDRVEKLVSESNEFIEMYKKALDERTTMLNDLFKLCEDQNKLLEKRND